MRFVFTYLGLGVGMAQRLSAIVNIMRNGSQIAHELTQTRCRRGADIARQLRALPTRSQPASTGSTSTGMAKASLRAQAIPIFSRIALLSQVIDVLHRSDGPEVAIHQARARAGQWFDPALVTALERVARNTAFWATLESPSIDRAVLALEPGGFRLPLDDAYLDDIATAFGQVVDSKSPFTCGHSARVAQFAEKIASVLQHIARVARLP